LSTRRAWSTLLSRTNTCKKHSFRVQVERIDRIKVLAPARNDGVVVIDFYRC
jgi:hypothetical protein